MLPSTHQTNGDGFILQWMRNCLEEMIKMQPIKKGLLIGGLALLVSVFPVKEASGLDGNVEYIKSEEKDGSYLRTSNFYGLPGKVNGFSVLELYEHGDGYWAASFLEKPLSGMFNARLRLLHDNEPLSEAGLGVSVNVPNLPKSTFLNFHYDPFFVSNKGEIVDDKSFLGYYVSVDLPKGFEASSFGEWNLSNPDGVVWDYGEARIAKKFGNVSLGYNPALVS